MGRGDPQREEGESVQQRNSQQTMRFWKVEPRHLPTRHPSSYPQHPFFRFPIKTCSSTNLFLFLDHWYVLLPLHSRTLGGLYGYLPDGTSLSE